MSLFVSLYTAFVENILVLFGVIMSIILLHEKFLQFDWLRAVVFQFNLKYLHVEITKPLWVVVYVFTFGGAKRSGSDRECKYFPIGMNAREPLWR